MQSLLLLLMNMTPLIEESRFECIVATSSLEFMDDLDMAIGTLYNATSIRAKSLLLLLWIHGLQESYFMTIRDGKVRNGHQVYLF